MHSSLYCIPDKICLLIFRVLCKAFGENDKRERTEFWGICLIYRFDDLGWFIWWVWAVCVTVCVLCSVFYGWILSDVQCPASLGTTHRFQTNKKIPAFSTCSLATHTRIQIRIALLENLAASEGTGHFKIWSWAWVYVILRIKTIFWIPAGESKRRQSSFPHVPAM